MMAVTICSRMGMAYSELSTLGVRRAFRLAVACLESQADELEVALHLFAIPTEAFGKSDHNRRVIDNMLDSFRGAPVKRGLDALIDPSEMEAIMEIERQMAAENPWTTDPELIAKIHTEYGAMPIGAKRFKGDGLDGVRAIGIPV